MPLISDWDAEAFAKVTVGRATSLNQQGIEYLDLRGQARLLIAIYSASD